MASARPLLKLVDLSRIEVPYARGWEWQRRLLQHHMKLQEIKGNALAGHVLVMQHKSVYTLGSQTEADWLRTFHGEEDAGGNKLVYDTFEVERGGQATYHGPGQLVMYPIMDLNFFEKDINLYLRGLEQTVINVARNYEIESGRVEGLTGVWVGDSKISAVGIKLRRWITMHGLSLNVNPDMRYFDKIVPCGINDKAVGSLSAFNSSATIERVSKNLIEEFVNVFHVEFVDAIDNGIRNQRSDDRDKCLFEYLDRIDGLLGLERDYTVS